MTPTTSVVIPAYRSASTLDHVLAALEPQISGRDWRDVVIVDSSADGSGERLRERWPWAQVITPARRTPPGRARNLGARATRGERIAFLDADAVPSPGWLDALEDALRPEVAAVAGGIVNGTPGNRVGTAGYLLEFSEWLPHRTTPLLHAATCNLMIRRQAFQELGGFDDGVRAGEDTLLTFPLGREGRLGFAPAAAITHLNRTSLRAYLANQLILGGAFGLVCERLDFPYRVFGRPALAPLAGALRLVALTRRLLLNPNQFRAAAPVMPLIVLGLAAWSAGVARGPQALREDGSEDAAQPHTTP